MYMYVCIHCTCTCIYLIQWYIKEHFTNDIVEVLCLSDVTFATGLKLKVVTLEGVESACGLFATLMKGDSQLVCSYGAPETWMTTCTCNYTYVYV